MDQRAKVLTRPSAIFVTSPGLTFISHRPNNLILENAWMRISVFLHLQCAYVALHQCAVDCGGCWEKGKRPECVSAVSGGSPASLHYRGTAIPDTNGELLVFSWWGFHSACLTKTSLNFWAWNIYMRLCSKDVSGDAESEGSDLTEQTAFYIRQFQVPPLFSTFPYWLLLFTYKIKVHLSSNS